MRRRNQHQLTRTTGKEGRAMTELYQVTTMSENKEYAEGNEEGRLSTIQQSNGDIMRIRDDEYPVVGRLRIIQQ